MDIGASTTATVDEGDTCSTLHAVAKHLTGPTKGTNVHNKQHINDLSAPQAGPLSDSLAIRPVGSPLPEIATAIHHETLIVQHCTCFFSF